MAEYLRQLLGCDIELLHELISLRSGHVLRYCEIISGPFPYQQAIHLPIHPSRVTSFPVLWTVMTSLRRESTRPVSSAFEEIAPYSR